MRARVQGEAIKRTKVNSMQTIGYVLIKRNHAECSGEGKMEEMRRRVGSARDATQVERSFSGKRY